MKYLISLLFCFIVSIAYAQPTYKTTINVGTGGVIPTSNCCDSLPEVQIVKVASNINFNSTPTLTDITGLSVNLEAGGMYIFDGIIFSIGGNTSPFPGPSCTGGGKAALSGTATITALMWNGYALSEGAIRNIVAGSSFGTVFGNHLTSVQIVQYIFGTITVNAAGTLKLQFAQNTSCNGLDIPTLVYAGSYLKVTKIN